MFTKWRITRAKLAQETATYTLAWQIFRKATASYSLNLSATATDPDFGITAGNIGGNSPSLRSQAASGAAKVARTRFSVALPPEYVAGGAITLRIHTRTSPLAAGTATSTVDLQVYESDKEAGISSDLCATGAQDINSTTWADKDFTITPTALAPGDLLDMEIRADVNDTGATSNAIAHIGAVQLLMAIKG